MVEFVGRKGPPVEDEDAKAVVAWVEDELEFLVTSLEDIQLNVKYALPTKPRTGLLVYADGTKWNPGSGEGVYVFKSTGSWVFLG